MAGPTPPSRRPYAALAALALALPAAAGCGGRAQDTTPTTVVDGLACPAGGRVSDAVAAGAVEPIPLGPPSDQAAGPGLDVGALLPRSGDLAFLGAPAVAAVELAVDDLNEAGGVLGGPVVLRHADSAEGTEGAAEAAIAALLAAGTDAVVGPLSSSATGVVLDRVAAAGAVAVSPGATSVALDRLDAGGRLFRTVATEALQGRALARLVLGDGSRSVDLVVRADAYGEAVAGGFTEELVDGGGTVARRYDRAPTDRSPDLGPLDEGRPADATVLVGLADVVPVLDELVDAGRGPRQHPTYGTDGILGERLGDLVADRSSLACLRGLLAVAPADDGFAAAVRAELRALGVGAAGDGPLALDHAAEAYDAVVAVAVAAHASGAADGATIAAALPAATSGGTPCDSPARCLELARDGVDLAYVGRSGPLPLGAQGNRRAAVLTLVAFDDRGHLARLGPRAVP